VTRPSDILRAARGLIAEPGHWAQGASRVGVAVCAAEAIDSSVGRDYDAIDVAYRYLKRIIGADPGVEGFISSWNDAPERTHAEVLAAFDAAIALAEREEKP